MPVPKRKRSKRRQAQTERSFEVIAGSSHEHYFVNRELSWLQFNLRVLTQAADAFLPLLERLRFLGIFDSNLDEFFMKRVGGLKRQVSAGVTTISPDGLSPRQQLSSIRHALHPLLRQQEHIFVEEVRPALAREGVALVSWSDLSEDERLFASQYFEHQVFPLLTPLSVDSGHPFPFISNLSLSLGFSLSHPDYEDPLFARVKVDSHLPQWIRLPAQENQTDSRFLSIAELIAQNAEILFPGMKILSHMPFRVTRNIDLDVDDEDAEDLMEAIEEELRARRAGQVVRLEHSANPDPWILQFLLDELELEADDVFESKGLLDYSGLSPILDLDLPRLKFPHWLPATPANLGDEVNIFQAIRSHDILVHHPYESFTASVERFIRDAAHDPKVISIKMTIYRVGQVTPLIPYLIRAAEEGKDVVCLVELKARFDEKHNIYWAQELEKGGVHVVYGIPGLKTHAKAVLVVRQDNDGLRAYAHCGTGNYNSKTSNLYTDFGLFTAKSEFTREFMHFFNYLSGRSLKEDYQNLLVAPITMEKSFIKLIENEAENARQAKPARIIAKMNSLEDRHLIEKLYEASQAGVQIDLLVRGACCLRPGVPGLSESIRVVSVIGRLLEHSRAFYFRNAAADPVDGAFYIASADWMGRNMHRRVELSIPVQDRPLRERIWHVFCVMLEDYKQAWEMQSDGFYMRRPFLPGKNPLGTHETLMAQKPDTSPSSIPL
jgi:polyphosphate kinase